jgi:hypothetical protein
MQLLRFGICSCIFGKERNKKPTKTTKKKKKVGKFKKITTKWMGETKMQSEGLEI